MLKLTVAVLAVVLAGTASAAGWRKLQIDASTEAAFQESVATFQDKLSPSRRVAFARSLQDVWLQGTQRATAEQRDYTVADYFRDVDGLGYDEVVKLTDPTGKKAQQYRAQYYYTRASGPVGSTTGWTEGRHPPPVNSGVYRGAGRAIDGGVVIGADPAP